MTAARLLVDLPAEANPLRWARDQWFSYMPKLRPIFLTGRQPAWDWPDVIRLLAPRALFLHNTTEDAIFPEAESAHAAAEAARPLWARDGHATIRRCEIGASPLEAI